MQIFGMVGAAVALVQGNDIAYSRGFGVRDKTSGAPVTPSTLFRIASLTKSMTSLLVATYVDDGLVGWDQSVLEIWPDFRAPTPQLTQQLRVRDLMGADSGLTEIGAADSAEFYASGGAESALDLLRSIAYLPVTDPPGTRYYYNNTVYAAGGYVPPLALGTAPESLDQAYISLARQRVFDPIGMTSAAIAADPSSLSDEYATPYTRNLLGGNAALPFNSIGGAAPAGSGIASVTDLARYLITEINRGVSPGGTPVVSAANLAETWKPHIAIPTSPAIQPDTTSLGYGMGWASERFGDGREAVWHTGSIGGSAALIGFLPQDRVGYAILTNMEADFGGALFHLALQTGLHARLLGVNQGVAAKIAAAYAEVQKRPTTLAAQVGPVNVAAVRPYLGYYSRGWHVELSDPRTLRLRHDVRSTPLGAVPDGSYVGLDGPLLSKHVSFTSAAGSEPQMAIDGFAPVTWLTSA